MLSILCLYECRIEWSAVVTEQAPHHEPHELREMLVTRFESANYSPWLYGKWSVSPQSALSRASSGVRRGGIGPALTAVSSIHLSISQLPRTHFPFSQQFQSRPLNDQISRSWMPRRWVNWRELRRVNASEGVQGATLALSLRLLTVPTISCRMKTGHPRVHRIEVNALLILDKRN